MAFAFSTSTIRMQNFALAILEALVVGLGGFRIFYFHYKDAKFHVCLERMRVRILWGRFLILLMFSL